MAKIAALITFVVVALVVLAGITYAIHLEPLTISGRGVSTNGVPTVRNTHPITVSYAPAGQVYLSIVVTNSARVPIRITGLESDARWPSYGASLLRIDPQTGGGILPYSKTRPFKPLTLGSGETRTLMVVYEPNRECRGLPAEASQSEGFAGQVFEAVALHFSVFGFISRTQVLDLGHAFRVPQPSKADCLAG